MQIHDLFSYDESGMLLLFGGAVLVCNYRIAIRWYLFRKRESLITLIGGVFFAFGMLLCPVVEVRRWFWIPLVLDFSIPGFLYSVIVLSFFRKR